MIRKCKVTTGFKRSESLYATDDIVYLVLNECDDELGLEDSRWCMLNVEYEYYYYKDGKFDHPIETITDFDTYDEAIEHVQVNEPKDPEIELKQISIQHMLTAASTETKQSGSTAIVSAAKDFKLEAAKMTASALSYGIQAQRHVENIKRLYSLKAKKLADELALKAKNMSEEIQIKMKEMRAMLAKAEEALWTVNLYLGVNQQTKIIRDGTHAPADVKLCLRQRVLAMDEEAAEEFYDMPNSIDCDNLHKFDNWLLKTPAAVQKLIPEQKGMIGLCIRGAAKHYEGSDPFTSAEKNSKNLNTSFLLIKNGDALYRIYADIHFGGKMFPTEDDFENNLSKTTWSETEKKFVKEPLDPKSKEFADAMEKANDSTKHYMRVLLVLQGLFDRTEVFRPFRGEHINICSYADFDDHITLIDDANSHKLIEEDKMPYDKWLAKVNSTIDVGHRICGHFNGVSQYKGVHGEEPRICPAGAERPSNDDIHLLTKTDYAKDPKFFFTYDRTEEQYYEAGYGSVRRRQGFKYEKRKPKTRARCHVDRNDWFYIDIDNCEIADIQYYLRSRKERKNNRYMTMLPVMKQVLALRLREQEDEKPFRTLLVAEIVKKYKANETKVEQEIDQLIKWWKLRNKTHRALLSDDSKAYKMIVGEYKQLLKRQDTSISHDAIEVIKNELKKEVLLIAKKGQHNIYVTYEICHKWSSVLVDEKEWTVNAGVASLAKDKKETVVDNRFTRWLISYESPKWTTWTRNANYYKLVTQEHIDEITRQLKERSSHPDSIVVSKDGMHASAWYVKNGKIKFNEAKNPLCQSLVEPRLQQAEVNNIGRNNAGITCTLSKYPDTYIARRENRVCAVKFDTKIFDRMTRIHKKNKEKLEAAQKLITEKYTYVINHIVKTSKETATAARRARFYAEYGGIWNEDLWNEWIKNRPVGSLHPRDDGFKILRCFLTLASLRNIDIVGMKLATFAKKMLKVFNIKNNNPQRTMHICSDCDQCKRLKKIMRLIGSSYVTYGGFRSSDIDSCDGVEEEYNKLLKLIKGLDITIPPPLAPETPEEDD